MLIEDGGGGYGGTDWSAMDVVAMWQAIENQDTNPHWQMLSGWRKSYELTLQHLAQVKNYRDNLATAWPPGKSPASAAYLTRLDQLIESLQATYDAAVANYGAFSGATAALATSRSELKKIYDAYVANQAKLADFRAKASRPVGGKALAPPAKPPVTDAQQEQLNNQARAIMYGLSSEIIQARSTLTTPKIYDPVAVRGGSGNDVGGSDYVAPPIPPTVPLHPGAGPTSVTSQPSTAHSAPPTGQPLTMPPASGGQPGLVLGGVSPSIVSTPPAPTGVAPPPSTGVGLAPGSVIAPTPVLPATPAGSAPPGIKPPIATGQVRGGMGTMGGDSPPRPGTTATTSGGSRVFGPGAVIGGVPIVGVNQPSTGTRTTQRINPIGGIINPVSGTTSGPSGRTTGHWGQRFGGIGQRSSEHPDRSNPHPWDPDNPWKTTEGVLPVVLPPGQQRVDPGPAIGLH